MNVFNHSGAQGDIIYSLPTIKRLGGGMLKINAKESIVDNLRPLLLMQPYIDHVVGMEYTGTITHDLDKFRLMPDLHKVHLVLSHMRAFGVDETNWNEPWLRVRPMPNEMQGLWNSIAYISKTPRYPAEGFDWGNEINYLKEKYQTVFFIGDEQDNDLCIRGGRMQNCLEMAECIMWSNMFTGNQSLPLAISEGLGHPYRMVVGDGLPNCIMGTPNEYIINQ